MLTQGLPHPFKTGHRASAPFLSGQGRSGETA
jgi:hypothetical protein